MPATYDSIASTTLGSDAASVTFSTISGSYTDLVIAINQKNAANDVAVGLRFNADSGSNYSITTLYGNGSSAASSRASNQSKGWYAYFVVPNTSIEYTALIHIMNYSNTTTNKTFIARGNRASANNFPGAEAIVGLWRSNSAITSIEISANAGNLGSGSTFTLYGIKAA